MKDLTIVFTDSGLGGLSIMTDFYLNLKRKQDLNATNTVNLVFYNALAETGQGYNKMPSTKEKIKTFNQALNNIETRHNPDILAIACNTLSAIYPSTSFAGKSGKVIEIISTGHEQIKSWHAQNPQTPIVVLATHTTIKSGAYNLPDHNVVQVSGENLASLIEFDYKGEDLKAVLHSVFRNIKAATKKDDPISLFLGCTHYGYIEDLLLETAQVQQIHVVEMLNPNKAFTQLALKKFAAFWPAVLTFKINLKIESQALIDPSEINSVCTLLQDVSPEITSLLKKYNHLTKQF